MGSELTLFEWGTRLVTPVGARLTAADAREGTLLKAVELLRSGVTCVNDLFVHANPGSAASLGVVEGLERAGLRGVVAFGPEDVVEGAEAMAAAGLDAILDEHRAGGRRRHGAGRLPLRHPHAAGAERRAARRRCRPVRSEGWGVHTHLAEVREEVVACALRWGRRPVEHAGHLGLLDLELVAAHAIWVTEGDVSLLADHGVAVAHNPVANMILGSGVCPVPRLRAAGVAVGIGTDGAASNDSQNLLEAIKVAALLQKLQHLEPAVIRADDVLEMATLGGARALGLEQRIGSLEAGKRADVVLFEGTVEVAVIHDPAAQLFYGASPRAVRDVWVDGRRLVAERRVVTVDEGEQIVRCRPLAARLVAEAGLSTAGLSLLR